MNAFDLAFTPALKLAELIRDRKVSPLELVELYLERISRLNPQLGSYFTVTVEQAIDDAKAKTALLSTNPTELPPFFGVPISIKDLNSVIDVPCTYGTSALLKYIPKYEDSVVTKIRQAGFIILGKTATSELGSFPYTEPISFPPSRNPWNLEYTSGGSSGGAAAAVAAGMCPIAQASDGGGSIRIPVACCGLFGIKPSRGRISPAPAGDRFGGIAINGPIARTVSDAAALLDVMSGNVPGDTYTLPKPESSFLSATQEKPGSLRVAYATDIHGIASSDATQKQAVLQTVQLLQELGHITTQTCPEFRGLVEPFQIIWQAGIAASEVPLETLQPMNRWLISRNITATEYVKAVAKMQIVSRQIASFFNDFDVLLLPVYLHSPIRVGEWAHLSPEDIFQNIIQWIAPCALANATGLPAVALPVGFDAFGLPMSVQFVGKAAAESTLISLAAQLEIAKPWIDKLPDFSNW
ncbi:amidase [Brunnivagina elsteri]|uniref:Amidase n=1 Tax=Brunnivagina elsteri CCALA 953 TaxID=987040 RepID=A0A2A2TF78_9CYAN|nr:amidase [Calothrix elsteri]PAX52404.1 amidase [Calothrix elsteri CCALA 953]